MGNKTSLVFFPAFDWAISPTHPEREERLLYTRDQFIEEGVLDLPDIVEYPAAVATPHEIARVHFCIPGVDYQTMTAHRIAAGSAISLSDKIMSGEVKNGFAIIRPPGHHAMRVVRGNRGFCNINNEAIVVEHLRRVYGVKRIAIIDTDVHHGDGTQDIYYHDPDVLFISFHQDGRTIYPGTGFTDELGGPRAFAYTLNIPLPPGTSDKSLLYVIENLILPVLNDFKPDFVLNSAGQDNHYSDPLGSMKITAQGYAKMTEMLKPDLAVLEGGYAIESALPYVNLAILLAMAGRDYSYVTEPDYDPDALSEDQSVTGYVCKLVEQLKEVWDSREKLCRMQYNKYDKYFYQQKHIYYDTIGFEEKQLERIRICSDCPGYIMIDSHVPYQFAKDGLRGVEYSRVLAVSIHNRCCENCVAEAWDVYNKSKKDERYAYVYVQDKTVDSFLTYRKSDGREWHTEG
ncbi:histone deacetylase [Peptococcaceae bacterium]|nr:histone deacetylase [Peptococcaceae bacterium]